MRLGELGRKDYQQLRRLARRIGKQSSQKYLSKITYHARNFVVISVQLRGDGTIVKTDVDGTIEGYMQSVYEIVRDASSSTALSAAMTIVGLT